MLILLLFYCYFNKGHLGYGRKNKNVKVSDEDAHKLYDLSMFNETDPKQMIQKQSNPVCNKNLID